MTNWPCQSPTRGVTRVVMVYDMYDMWLNRCLVVSPDLPRPIHVLNQPDQTPSFPLTATSMSAGGALPTIYNR